MKILYDIFDPSNPNMNKLMSKGDECYFLLTSTTEYNYPIICRGDIMVDQYIDVMEKEYHILFKNFLNSDEEIKAQKIYGQKFELFYYDPFKTSMERKCLVLDGLKFKESFFNISYNNKKLFKINSYFAKPITIELSDILKFRENYVKYIITDIENILKDSKFLINL